MLRLITKWKVNLLLMLFLTSGFCAFTQEDTTSTTEFKAKSVEDLVKAIDESGVYWETKSIYIGVRSNQIWRYDRLKRIASNDELILIVDTAGPAASAYAYRILVERNDPEVFNILLKNLHNTRMLEVGIREEVVYGEFDVHESQVPGNVNKKSYTLIGKDGIPEDDDFDYEMQTTFLVRDGLSYKFYLGDFFYDLVHKHKTSEVFCSRDNNVKINYLEKPSLGIDGEGYYLSQEESDYIKFQLLFDKKIKLEARNDLLREIEPDPDYYVRVKQIYLEEEIPEALIALARYQNKDDLPLIQELLESTDSKNRFMGVRALQYFPALELFEELKSIHLKLVQRRGLKYCYIRQTYETIVAYKTPDSRDLLEFSIYEVKKIQREYHLSQLQRALLLNNDEIYEGLFELSLLTPKNLKKSKEK